MLAKREIWNYPEGAKVWAGKYRNSHNLLHWHFDCEFISVERGKLEVFCEKKLHTLAEGEALFTDSGQMHYQRALEPDTVLRVIVFESSVFPALETFRLLSPKLAGVYPVAEAYERLFRALKEKKPFFGEEARCIVSELMINVFRGEAVVRRTGGDRTEDAFKRLLEDVEEHYEEYTFSDAVSFMGMSEAYFSRYFKAMTGTTFSQYLNYVRTDAAVRCLQEGRGMTMTEISEACGFSTIRNFNRIFKELTGHSPSRLPEGFVLNDPFSERSEQAFRPTLLGCELIESCEG